LTAIGEVTAIPPVRWSAGGREVVAVRGYEHFATRLAARAGA
jgi:hypothetical protein